MEGLDEKLNAKFSPMEVKMQRCMDHLDELQQILNDSTKIAHAITEVGVQMHDTDALVEEANSRRNKRCHTEGAGGNLLPGKLKEAYLSFNKLPRFCT